KLPNSANSPRRSYACTSASGMRSASATRPPSLSSPGPSSLSAVTSPPAHGPSVLRESWLSRRLSSRPQPTAPLLLGLTSRPPVRARRVARERPQDHPLVRDRGGDRLRQGSPGTDAAGDHRHPAHVRHHGAVGVERCPF